MQKTLPLWVFLLCLLLGALFTMFFGWFVRKSMLGATHHERLGDAAIAVASFPSLVKSSFKAMDGDRDARVRVPRTRADLSDFQPIKVAPGIRLEGLMVRADPAALARAAGWRILVGGFTIDGAFENAALVLSPELEVVKVWDLVEKDIPGTEPRAPYGKFIHGVAMLEDASIVFGFDYGVPLQRFDACGKRVWAIPGEFNHAVSVDESGMFVWTIDENTNDIVKVATANGAMAQRISMADIVAANPTIDILEIRQQDSDTGSDNADASRTNGRRMLFI